MNLQPFTIQGYQAGLETNKKPFALLDSAFPQLENAYCWRERITKREGLKLTGRLRRFFPVASIGNSGASPWSFNIYAVSIPPIVPEATAEIEPGSLIIVIGAITFTDQGDGTLTSVTLGNSGTINYLTGDVVLIHTAGAGVATTAVFGYFPSLPVMGIIQREISGINLEQTIFFDTIFAYIYDGEDFIEYLPATNTRWAGTDADFFWGTNYRGSEADQRLFFVTNFVNTATNPMRYTDGSTWTDFAPFIGSEQKTETFPNFLGGGAYADTLTNLPIIPGTVEITVNTVPPIVFRDTPKDGTLVASGLNNGTITYATGAFTLTFNPPIAVGSYEVQAVYNVGSIQLWQARILIPYYGRLLALNTWEGETQVGSVNIFNRCRFSQVGSPIQIDAWRSDTFGKGGFIDAPINEEIISAIFYKNTLIVFFERSTWQLRYVGEYGLPFIWERISSDFGSESTFSTLLFDEGVLAVGNRAIVSSSGTNVQRIDLQIPDQVFEFNNLQDGMERVHGIRDYKKELAYWCYSDGSLNTKFPNYSLLYNYRNNTYAIFRNNVTAFGILQAPGNITWDSLSVYWSSDIVTWSDNPNEQAELIVSGNQQGYVHYYGYPDMDTNADSEINANDQESLSITAIDLSTVPPQITVKNHNLQSDEIIYIVGLSFVDEVTDTGVATDLNDKFYMVSRIDADTLGIYQWSAIDGANIQNFSFTPPNGTATYFGGGELALMPKLLVKTKDFNLFEKQGVSSKISYVDFLVDAQEGAQATIKLFINSSEAVTANMNLANTLNTALDLSGSLPYYIPGSNYEWHRFYGGCNGQFIAVEITYDDTLMNTLATHNSLFVMNAMKIWGKAAGRSIF